MKLYQAICPPGRFEETIALVSSADSSADNRFELKGSSSIAPNLSLKRVGTLTSVVYSSAIAHQLAAQSQCDVSTLARQVVAALLQTRSSQLEVHLRSSLVEMQDVAVWATDSGLIQFAVGDRAIAAWLEQLVAPTLPSLLRIPRMTEVTQSPLQRSPRMFAIQHAHARCCSILRLAHNEQLITLDSLESSPISWRLVKPMPVVWLTPAAQLRLDHLADRHLIGQLVAALDLLSDSWSQRTPTAVLRSAEAVAQAFQGYHSAHRLCSSVGVEPAVVVARLGLLLVTQRVLYLLLSNGLDLDPVVEC